MATRITWPDSFTLRVRGIREAARDISPIMPELERLMWQDNERGLLAGQDKDGHRLAPLSARTIRYRRSAMGPADPNAPPLIPARRQSRAIANYRTGHVPDGPGRWLMLGTWVNFVTRGGFGIMNFHINGTRHLPKRDVDGVRPAGRRAISGALRDWLRETWTRP